MMSSRLTIGALLSMLLWPPTAFGAELEGTVKWSDGRPAVDATVSVAGYSVSTDDRGRYEFRSVGPGRHVMVVAAEGRPSRSFWVTIREGQSSSRDIIIDW